MHHLPSIQIEDCGSVDLTAYRYWYALGFLLYHTTQKMSNHSFRCFRKNKNDLTNRRKSRIIKTKRAHQQTVCSHCLWLRRNNRRELVASGRLFLFLAVVIRITIFMIIVNVQDHADQIQQKAADLQQITQGDVLIHHTDHLPSVRMSSGSRNKPPTVIGMPSSISYITLREKCQTIVYAAFRRHPQKTPASTGTSSR